MELFDKINEKNVVIGQTTKKKSHQNGDIHRVVAVFVFAKDNKLYIQKRSNDGKLDHSVGGHVKKGESYRQAVKREAKEELNLEGKFDKLATFLSIEKSTKPIEKNVRHMFCLYEHKPENWRFMPSEEVKILFSQTLEKTVSQMLISPQKFKKGFINTMKKYIYVKNIQNKNPLFEKFLD